MSPHFDKLSGSKVRPPRSILPWLNHTDELTEKLRAVSDSVRLQLLSQSWSLPHWWDRYILGILHQKVLHREIMMLGEEKPCWYARTIIPHSTYISHAALFDRLKKEPLGNLIFRGNAIQRHHFIRYPVTPDCIEYHWLHAELHQTKPILWARLSEFKVDRESPFYLSELFLPALLEHFS